jgi:xylulokinase
MQADIYGKKVSVINASEGPAYGVALLAAVGAKSYKNVVEACDATIKVVETTATDAKARKVYDSAHAIYQQLYRSLRSDFGTIARFVER